MAPEILTCRLCSADDLHEFEEFGRLPRVTSDCKPFPPGGRLAICRACGAVQKPADAAWQADCARIYGAYQPYYQSGGVEQAVFDPVSGRPARRSQILVDRLRRHLELGAGGRVLDIGSGNGVFLTAVAEALPAWDLYGQDLQDGSRATLEAIPGFRELYVGDLSSVPGGFDLVTMIHSLEHFAAPVTGAADAASRLRSDGHLFVQVPNASVTPFDLVIADHATHFSPSSLFAALAAAGLGVRSLETTWIVKELSAIAHPGAGHGLARPAGGPSVAQVAAQLGWLGALVDAAEAASRQARPFGLFGTSIASVWLFGQLRDRVDFFVDEDPSRAHTTLYGKPILPPAAAPRDGTVLVTLIPAVAQSVVDRLAAGPARYLPPPPA